MGKRDPEVPAGTMRPEDGGYRAHGACGESRWFECPALALRWLAEEEKKAHRREELQAGFR